MRAPNRWDIWVTAATYDQWVTRGNAHNAPLDCTLVYEDQRVVCNVGALYSGSFNTMQATGSPLDPLTQSPISGYNLVFPPQGFLLVWADGEPGQASIFFAPAGGLP